MNYEQQDSQSALSLVQGQTQYMIGSIYHYIESKSFSIRDSVGLASAFSNSLMFFTSFSQYSTQSMED